MNLLNESMMFEDEEASGEHNYNMRSFKTILAKRLLNVFGKLSHIGASVDSPNYVENVAPISGVYGNGVNVKFHSPELFVRGLDKIDPNYYSNNAGIYFQPNKNRFYVDFTLSRTEGYGWNQRTYNRKYGLSVPFKGKISVGKVDWLGDELATTIEMPAELFYFGYACERIGRTNLVLTFKGNIFEKVSSKTLKLENFKTEIKNAVANAVDDELNLDVGEFSISLDPETKTGKIRFHGYGKGTNSGWSYSGQSESKYYGGNWKILSAYADEAEGDYGLRDFNGSVKDITERICKVIMPIFEKYGQKIPKILKISYYAEYD